jgi:hypothetical protein
VSGKVPLKQGGAFSADQGVCQSPLLAPGDAFTQTFDTPGVFPYICAVHPFIRSPRLIVTEGSLTSASL